MCDFCMLMDEPRFYPVDIVFGEVGTSISIRDLVEIRARAGAIWFTSRNPETGQRVHRDQADCDVSSNSLQSPTSLAKPGRHSVGISSRYFKESIIIGTVNQGDLRANRGPSFSRSSQRVESMGFIIDLDSLLAARREPPYSGSRIQLPLILRRRNLRSVS